MTRYTFIACFTACLSLFVGSNALVFGASDVIEIEGETMGTTYHIKWADDVKQAEEIHQLVDARLREINSLMSTYDPESELSRFNQSQQTDWFEVSAETAKVVDAALQVSKISQGAFDPTVGRLVKLWSFGSDPRSFEPPSDAAIEGALKSVGYQKLSVRLDPPALSKSDPDVDVDLSAIAKGYGVDAIVELLAAKSIQNCMVEIGGETRVTGNKHGAPWTLGIERPEELTHSLYAKVELNNQALATSGNYRNYFESEGIRYSHTIDPRTGRPVRHQLASASIIASDCMTADAWATTMMVLGPEQGLALADEQSISAYLLEHNGESLRELASKAVVNQYVNLTAATPADENQLSPFLTTFLLSLSVFGIAIIGLAAGVILANKTLKGSCGGVSGQKDEQGKSICELCTTPPEECDQFKEKLRQQLQESSSKTDE